MRWLILLTGLWSGTAVAAPSVVADIPPVHSLVAQVMAGVGAPGLLLDGSASPHGGSLRPSQARALDKADLVVWIGPALTPWLEQHTAGVESLALLEASGTHRLAMREGGGLHNQAHDDEHGDKHDDQHDDEHADEHDHGHDHGDSLFDPHAWLDPANGRVWLTAIAQALARIDPENADAYAANAAAGQRAIAATEARITAQLSALDEQRFAVAHDAFQYFEARFGLEAVAALSAADGHRAGPRELRAVRDRIREAGAGCLVAEPGGNFPDRLAAVTDARVTRLDPLGSALDVGAGLYPALMTTIADGFAECFKAD